MRAGVTTGDRIQVWTEVYQEVKTLQGTKKMVLHNNQGLKIHYWRIKAETERKAEPKWYLQEHKLRTHEAENLEAWSRRLKSKSDRKNKQTNRNTKVMKAQPNRTQTPHDITQTVLLLTYEKKSCLDYYHAGKTSTICSKSFRNNKDQSRRR